MKKWYLNEDFSIAELVDFANFGVDQSRIKGTGIWVPNFMVFDTELEASDAAVKQAQDYLDTVVLWRNKVRFCGERTTEL